MISRRTIVLSGAALAALTPLTGCESNSLRDPDHVRAWVNAGSALAVYVHAYDPLRCADGRGDNADVGCAPGAAMPDGEGPFADPECPTRERDDAGTITIAGGGCTDLGGKDWVGRAVITGAGGERTVTFDGFGSFDDPDFRSTVTGTLTRRQTSPGLHAYDADLRVRGGVTTRIEYSGTVEGDYGTATKWNGSGTVDRDGVVAPQGRVNVATVDEVVDDTVCSGQPVSGTTTLQSGSRVTVVTYDGATDCDDDANARWSVDGEDRGLIDGITCAVASPGAASRSPAAPVAGLLGVACMALLLPRRRGNASRS